MSAKSLGLPFVSSFSIPYIVFLLSDLLVCNNGHPIIITENVLAGRQGVVFLCTSASHLEKDHSVMLLALILITSGTLLVSALLLNKSFSLTNYANHSFVVCTHSTDCEVSYHSNVYSSCCFFAFNI